MHLFACFNSTYFKVFALLHFTALWLVPSPAAAQASARDREVIVSVGAGSLYNLLENSLARGDDHYYSSGIYGISYRYHLSRRFNVGGNVTYEYVSGRHTNHVREAILTLAPEATFSYTDRTIGRNKIRLRLYCLAAAGISLYDNLNNDVNFAPFPDVQVSPLGIRIGNTLAPFAEFGFGYKGLVNAGLSYHIQKRRGRSAHE